MRRALVSIHAPRMGRDVGRVRYGTHGFVSIHAPRMGRDTREVKERGK